MMFDRTRFKELCIERDATDWDYLIDQITEEMIWLSTKDEEAFREFVSYMKVEMTGPEYACLSEISDEIAAERPSYEFIEAYRFLAEKYPEETKRYRIQPFIDDAEGIVEACFEEMEAMKAKK